MQARCAADLHEWDASLTWIGMILGFSARRAGDQPAGHSAMPGTSSG